MVYIVNTLINMSMVAIQIPGMLDGNPYSIFAGILCSAFTGATIAGGIVDSIHNRNMD